MRTLEEIYNEMVAQYEESAGLVMEKGGDMSWKAMWSPQISWISSLQAAMSNILRRWKFVF